MESAEPSEVVSRRCQEVIDQHALAEEHEGLITVTEVFTRLRYEGPDLVSILRRKTAIPAKSMDDPLTSGRGKACGVSPRMSEDPREEDRRLLERLRGGDPEALGELFAAHRARLRRTVELRMDWRLQSRLDASDVLQDAFLDAAARVDNYLVEAKLPPFLWLRLIVGERLATVHRHHLGTRMRDAGREVSLHRQAMPEASSAALASMLLGRHTSPTQAAVRAERISRLQEALNALDPIDREILALRHFEQLNRVEAAQVLGLTEDAGAKRYLRALKRLKTILAELPGGLEGV